MLERYSSRQGDLVKLFLNPRLQGALQYDRLAGYFSSSVLEVAGEALESVQGAIRVVCNSAVESRDVATAKAASRALLREWRQANTNEAAQLHRDRFEKLYNLLVSEKMQVRVLPNDVYGMMHAKAGVITQSNGDKVAFVGSVNETAAGWRGNYEILWADDSPESVQWVQEEFDHFWNHPRAMDLDQAVVDDIGLLARGTLVSIEEWRQNPKPPVVLVGTPFYIEGADLWNHQKYFINMAFSEHVRKGGARYILADEVGLGKTAQLALLAELIALYDGGPVLIIVPKALMSQWQEEMWESWAIPAAAFDGKGWLLEDGTYESGDIAEWPRKITLVSQGLFVHDSEAIQPLFETTFSCVIIDEAHRVRRKNLNKEEQHPEPNNLMRAALKLSQRTKSMILATATPVQLKPVEAWDLLYVLAQGSERVLGKVFSPWHKIKKAVEISTGQVEITDLKEAWEWMKNPLPGDDEDNASENLSRLRKLLGLKSTESFAHKNFDELTQNEKEQVRRLLKEDYFKKYNPFIRFIVRRRRELLEERGLLEKISVHFPHEQSDGLILSPGMERAYDLTRRFTDLMRVRGAKGFYRVLLLKRIGSSIRAGYESALRLLQKRQLTDEEVEEYLELEEEGRGGIYLASLSDEELGILEEVVDLLKEREGEDPKFHRLIELLFGPEGWYERGCIIFSEYYDTASWVARKLSEKVPEIPVALYAGIGAGSGICRGGEFIVLSREEVRDYVQKRKVRLMVGTDAAGEGLNLQTLGSIVNFDLPWNPTRLEQRIGRIRRAGQIFDPVYAYNLFYKDSIESYIHKVLLRRVGIAEVLLGPVPQVLLEANEGWDTDETESLHPFDEKYMRHIGPVDWSDVKEFISKQDRLDYLSQGMKLEPTQIVPDDQLGWFSQR